MELGGVSGLLCAASFASLSTAVLLLFRARTRERNVRVALAEAVSRNRTLCLEVLQHRRAVMNASPSSVDRARSFKPRASDILIATYPKSGTTWASHILHSLRSGGDLDYREITDVVPYNLFAEDLGQKLDADQGWEPRLFKTHDSADVLSQGGRYVVVFRDPTDVLLSMHEYVLAYCGLLPDDVDVADFAHAMLHENVYSADLWQFMLGHWLRRHHSGCLLLFYEDMVDDTPSQVRRLAAFMGVADEDVIQLAVKQASREFMTSDEHAHRFDDSPVRTVCIRALANRLACLPALGEFNPHAAAKAKLASAERASSRQRVRARAEESGSIAKFEARWAKVIHAATGLTGYAEMRRAFATEQL